MLEPRPEQWKYEGNCRYCRRLKYCNKKCSANKRLCEMMIQNAIRQSKIAKALSTAIPEKEYTDG